MSVEVGRQIVTGKSVEEAQQELSAQVPFCTPSLHQWEPVSSATPLPISHFDGARCKCMAMQLALCRCGCGNEHLKMIAAPPIKLDG